MGGQPLAGRTIVVTRPAGQADSLCAALTALGAEALCFPLLTIAPVADPAPLQAMARRVAGFLSALTQPLRFHPQAQPFSSASMTYLESEYSSTTHGSRSASSAEMTAMSSMRLLVVLA